MNSIIDNQPRQRRESSAEKALFGSAMQLRSGPSVHGCRRQPAETRRALLRAIHQSKLFVHKKIQQTL